MKSAGIQLNRWLDMFRPITELTINPIVPHLQEIKAYMQPEARIKNGKMSINISSSRL